MGSNPFEVSEDFREESLDDIMFRIQRTRELSKNFTSWWTTLTNLVTESSIFRRKNQYASFWDENMEDEDPHAIPFYKEPERRLVARSLSALRNKVYSALMPRTQKVVGLDKAG